MPRDTRKAEFLKSAKSAAKSAIASMRDDLAALEHANDCDGTTPSGRKCNRGNECRTFKYEDGRTGKQHRHENPEAWHDADLARNVIEQGILSIQFRTGWFTRGQRHDAEAEEYELLLGTGGPATRIVGTIDRGQASTAHFEFQDWFQPWTRVQLKSADEDTLLEWAQVHYMEDNE